MISRKNAMANRFPVGGGCPSLLREGPCSAGPEHAAGREDLQSGGEMVTIPAGFYEMGSRHGRDEEKPVHKVRIDSFLIDRHEVTQAEYEMIGKIEAFPNPSHFDGSDRPKDRRLPRHDDQD